MTDTTDPTPRELAKSAAGFLWWITLIRGILLLTLGIYALFRPGMSAIALTQVVGMIVIIEGIFAIMAAILGDQPSRALTLVRGALAILLGILIFSHSAIAAKLAITTILYIIGASVILIGIMEIVAAIHDRKQIEGAGGIILCGVLWVIFGIILFIAPISFGVFIVRVLGAFAILAGISLIGLAYNIRRIKKGL